MTVAKNAVLQAVCAAQMLEELLNSEKDPVSPQDGLNQMKAMLSKQTKKDTQNLEQQITRILKTDGSLLAIPDLLACDMYYYSAGVNIRAYRTEKSIYQSITESIRAEILEDGPVTRDCICLLWLLRESGCMHDIFSVTEQREVAERIPAVCTADPFCRLLWDTEIHSACAQLITGFLHNKGKLFQNPYLEGVNLIFPFFDRRKAIFVDYVILGSCVAGRRMAMAAFLSEQGHYVEEVKYGDETLLKIDNMFYRIFPGAVSCGPIPVQGAHLLPVYL